VVKKVTIHPGYVRFQTRHNNIAIIKTKDKLDSNRYRILPIRGLTTNSTYSLLDTIITIVTVYGPEFCDQTSPQAFCSKHNFLDSVCLTQTAVPLIGENAFLDGFLLNEGTCSLELNSYNLYYHSVGDFTDWIREVSGATMVTKVSILTLVSAMLISFAGFM
jgi:hypothetical protein